MLKKKEVSNIPSLYLGGGVIHTFYFDPYLGKILNLNHQLVILTPI